MDTPPERKRIHWDRSVNIGNILSTVASIVISLIFVLESWYTMDKRVAVLETNNQVKESLADIKHSIEDLRRDIQGNRK